MKRFKRNIIKLVKKTRHTKRLYIIFISCIIFLASYALVMTIIYLHVSESLKGAENSTLGLSGELEELKSASFNALKEKEERINTLNSKINNLESRNEELNSEKDDLATKKDDLQYQADMANNQSNYLKRSIDNYDDCIVMFKGESGILKSSDQEFCNLLNLH